RTEPRWEDRVRHDYEERRTNKDLRPPRTYRELETRVAKAPEAQRQNIQVVQKLSVVVNNSTKNVTNVREADKTVTKTAAPLKFEKINTETQTKIVKQAQDVHKFR